MNTKNQKGSISLFVLLSCLFFLVVVTSVAVSAKNKEAKVDAEIARIKAIYEKDVGNEEAIYNEKIAELPAIWDGTSTESPKFKDFHWYIYTPAQLKFLADFVNNGNTLTSDQETLVTNAGYETSDVTMSSATTVYLMNDLDLGASAGTGSTEEEKWETSENETVKWTQIGIDSSTKKFIGIFEGNNYTIKGVYVNSTITGTGLFGQAGNNISNLTIADSYIKGQNYTGGIVGSLLAGAIDNCHNENTTVILKDGTYTRVGGIAGGSSGNISNCSNTGNIIGNGIDGSRSRIGGIAGWTATVTISKCSNSGTVTANGEWVGGIGGFPGDRSTISECSNTGDITGEKGYVGGIVGQSGNYVTMSSCWNTGYITGKEGYIGGIAGTSTASSILSECYNGGAIEGGGNVVGGIAGNASNSGKIDKCYNKGTVTGTGNSVGGIVGNMGATAELTNCYYLSSIGVSKGVGAGLATQNNNAKVTDEDFVSLTEFLEWLESQ